MDYEVSYDGNSILVKGHGSDKHINLDIGFVQKYGADVFEKYALYGDNDMRGWMKFAYIDTDGSPHLRVRKGGEGLDFVSISVAMPKDILNKIVRLAEDNGMYGESPYEEPVYPDDL